MPQDSFQDEILVKVAKILDKLKISYYVSGGFAVSVYGRARFTADIDIVIKFLSSDIAPLVREMNKVASAAYIDEQQIESALAHQSEFNFIDPNTNIKIDFFVIKQSAFEQQALKNSKKINTGYPVNFISPEDLIISKLMWYKEGQSTRQLEDINSVLKISKVNLVYIHQWVKQLNLSKEYQKAKELLK